MVQTLKTWVQSLGQEDPLEKGMATHPVFLPGKLHGQRSLVGYSPWDHKESDMTEQLTYTHIHFFSFIFISWSLITLQYCSGFCHTLT